MCDMYKNILKFEGHISTREGILAPQCTPSILGKGRRFEHKKNALKPFLDVDTHVLKF